MAAYGRGGSKYDCTRPGEWECEEWSWCDGDDLGLVWVWNLGGCDTGVVGDDFEYSVVGSVDG